MSTPQNTVGGQYKIIRQLGYGSFGTTYLAEDLRAKNRKCVVKHLTFSSSDQVALLKAKELFEREAGVLFDLSNLHKNQQIPQFFAYFADNQEFYLVEEWIDGHTLCEELQNNGPLIEDEIVNLLIDALEILRFIHNQDIIHRDIKPENLMRRNEDGKLVLIDFGTVKEVVIKSKINQTQLSKPTVIYTVGYAPPEQCQGKPEKNSDLYALGMTALEMLTGLPPDKIKDRNTGEILWPTNLKIRPELVKILEKLVHDNCKSRYQSAEFVLGAIRTITQTWLLAPVNTSSSIQKTNLVSNRFPSFFKLEILAPVLVAVVAGASFFAANSLVNSLRESSVTNNNPESTVTPITSIPENSEIDNPPKSVKANGLETNLNSGVKTTKDTNKNLSLDVDISKEDNINSNANDSYILPPIRFKRAKISPSVKSVVDPEPKPNSTQPSFASENQIRFKEAK
ncbi:MAG: serine/threonine protein kinase [Desmonostoc geniculatum HA4340-LM1]|jgi:serine/threonine-protein kinase|nr:serine/threonine protein kinase [Desmonostoc geniculatum HA4340-LM1]